MQISFTVPVTYRYIARAARASLRLPFRAISISGIVLVVLQLGLLGLGGGDAPLFPGAFGLVFLVLPSILTWVLYWQAPGKPEVAFVLTHEGLHGTTPTMASTMKWEAFTRYRETKEFFLLRLPNRSSVALPKEHFTAAEADQLRERLATLHL